MGLRVFPLLAKPVHITQTCNLFLETNFEEELYSSYHNRIIWEIHLGLRRASAVSVYLFTAELHLPAVTIFIYKWSNVTEWLWLPYLGTFQFPLLLEEGQTLAATKPLVEVPLGYVYV